MYRLGITFISTFILSMLPLIAQQPPETASIDSITYQQYLQKDYQKLIETSKKARARQIGFYYLDYRTAIAYFELKNYANAARYYRKTLEQNPGDPVLLESLYYAYLLSGQKKQMPILLHGRCRLMSRPPSDTLRKWLTIYRFRVAIPTAGTLPNWGGVNSRGG